MIQYALKCDEDHSFDSWFHSAAAFEKLHNSGMLECVVCGSINVSKAIMAPRVNAGSVSRGQLSTPASPAEQALAKLRKKIEDNADYVGTKFAAEARAIHDGTAPDRPIYGEARLVDARKLVDDGVPVAPLPFTPNRKAN